MHTEISHSRFLAFDLEMTGLSPKNDSIIEIGAVPLLGLLVDGDYFFTSVQPYTNVRASSKKIHGLDGDDLWDAPPAEIAIPNFFKMMNGRILIGQHPQLDLAFLWTAAKNIGGNIPCDWAIDISKVFEKVYPNQHGFSLDSMAHRVGLRRASEFHNALGDAILAIEIFSKIMPKLQRMGIHSLDDLISLGRVKIEY
ncbi:3'-5' exonuclease [bacterium]|nr:3'-5' exonuclease [bacterium]